MSDERYMVLSALMDREPVDPDALSATINTAEGRAALVDLVRLRTLVAAELDSEPAIQAQRSSAVIGSGAWRWVAAALIPFAVGLGGGYWWRVRAESRPPTPTRIVQFVPGVDWK